MNLGLLRPGRFVAAHLAAVLVALAVGLATRHAAHGPRRGGRRRPVSHVATQARHRRAQRHARAALPAARRGHAALLLHHVDRLERRTRSTSVLRSSTCSATRSPSGRRIRSSSRRSSIRSTASACSVRSRARRRRWHPYEAEYRLYHKDGTVVWVQDRAVTVQRRARRALPLAGLPRRRHGAQAGGGALPHARRAAAADHVHRHSVLGRRSRDVRQPSDRADPRLQPRGVAREPRLLRRASPSGGSRSRARGSARGARRAPSRSTSSIGSSPPTGASSG